MTLSYDGTNYFGYQDQEGYNSIEKELYKAFYLWLKKDVKLISSGRTDKGVHALRQKVNVKLDINIKPNDFKRAINSFLPSDIYVVDVNIVDDNFHARFSCKKKEYRYYITDKYSVFNNKYMAYYYNIDYKKIKTALKLFLGQHDFFGFSGLDSDTKKNTIRNIYKIKLKKLKNYYEFIFIGDGFLKYQIRKIMGTLIYIGLGKESIDIIDLIFKTKDTKLSRYLAPSCGLYLYDVYY